MVLSSALGVGGARRLRVALDEIAQQRPRVGAEVQLHERARQLPHRLRHLGRRRVDGQHLLELGGRVRVLALLHERHADRQVGLRGARVGREALDEHAVEAPPVVALPRRQSLRRLLPELLLVVGHRGRDLVDDLGLQSAPAPPAGSPAGCARRRTAGSAARSRGSAPRSAPAAPRCPARPWPPWPRRRPSCASAAWSPGRAPSRSRTTCSLYSLSRFSISSSLSAQVGDVGAHLLAFAGGHARGAGPRRQTTAASEQRARATRGVWTVTSR